MTDKINRNVCFIVRGPGRPSPPVCACVRTPGHVRFLPCVMPDHDSTTLLTRQTKRRRVDIGVKRTVASAIFSRARETLLDNMNQHGHMDQDQDCSLVGHGHHGAANGDGEKSNVLRKLLKRANSYEDAIMPFPGATIISQLLKNNMGKNGGSDAAFQVHTHTPSLLHLLRSFISWREVKLTG